MSLLCCDSKIYSKILANRIQLVVDDLIHPDQAGFIKGRSIAQNLMDLNSVIYTSNEQNLETVIVVIDFLKAYDTIEWSSFYQALAAFNFGPKFIDMIKVCHRNIKSYVINNGHLSDEIPISRGFRQGCPLSCLCFDLMIEIIAVRIRSNDNIEGISIGTKTKKLGQYADDLWISVKNKKRCFLELFQELNHFGRVSGLNINYDKTEILRLGSLRNSNAKFYSELPLQWSDGPVRILGIMYTSQLRESASINYKQLVKKCCNITKMWSKRSLSLLGRILIVNTLLIPTFVYRLQVLQSPSKEIYKEFKRIVRQFLWDNKGAKISYDRLILSYKSGGLKLMDLEMKDTALKTKWIQLSSLQDTLYGEIIKNFIPLSSKHIAEVNLAPRDVKVLCHDSFVRDMLLAWSAINHHRPTSANQIKNQIIWFNSFIKAKDGKPLFFKNWYNKGIIYLEQLLDRFGNYKSLAELQQYVKEINFLELHRLHKAIPKEWLRAIKNEVKTEIEFPAKSIVKNNTRCTKIVYDTLRG